MTTPTIEIGDFTTEDKATGTGVFDVMMRSVKEHMVDEYTKGRIKGPEYSTVYLGALQATMSQGLEFLLNKDKITAELALLEVQRQIAEIEKDKALTEKQLIEAQVAKINVEIEVAELQKGQITAETARIGAQTALLEKQALNAVKEGAVLDAQACKLKGEFDLIMAQIPKVAAEVELLTQKKATEQAQINGSGVDADSVVGRQIQLYGAQADGFQRDAEQKAAKLMIDTWNVRRTTDEGTSANTQNKLDDTTIGAFVNKLRAGVGA